MFAKILIANRGEIACRVMRTARAMGVATVAVYSDADAGALHVRSADAAVRLGGPAARDSYLDGGAVIAAARATGAQAIHPGYGFLSENAEFAQGCADAGLVFIGPSPAAITAMGLKDRAKAIMAAAGVPVVPGYQGDDQSPARLQAEADKIGYPALIKAVAGGGGKGMRLVERAKDFAAALESCRREAQASFGNPDVLIEKYVTQPRHIEMQVFGDAHGNAVHLFERDCSLQRRHQKVIEEAPAPGLPADVRKRLGEAAVQAVKAIGYMNAGTLEFIMDARTHDFYFMEMNTRLQVEHPVTEAITGLDLVEWQLRVAAGEELPLRQADIRLRGHAFEARLYAEDPAQGFLPQVGIVTAFAAPSLRGAKAPKQSRAAPDGPGLLRCARNDEEIRIDTGLETGDAVTIFYDPMIAKIICHGEDRAAALAVMRRALAETVIAGPRTNLEFLGRIFADPEFMAGAVDTGFIARRGAELVPADYGQPHPADWAAAAIFLMFGDAPPAPGGPWDAGDNWRNGSVYRRRFALSHRGGDAVMEVTQNGADLSIHAEAHEFSATNIRRRPGEIHFDLDGQPVIARLVRDGRHLHIFSNGRVVTLFETPRRFGGGMATGRVVAPMPGRIVAVSAATGDSVEKDRALLVMEAMKMEITIRAPASGRVASLTVQAGDQVADGALLAVIEA